VENLSNEAQKNTTASSQGKIGGSEVSVAVTLIGKDSSGREFRENVRTLFVSRLGAKVATTHKLDSGAEIQVENRKLGRREKARVTWIGDRSSPRDPWQISIELPGAESIWGIEFPPEDSRETSLETAGKTIGRPAEAASAPSIHTGEEGEMPKSTESAATPMSPENPAEVSNSLREALKAATQNFEQQLSALASQYCAQAEEKMRTAAEGLDKQLQGMMAKLDAAHRDLDALLNSHKATQESSRRESERAQAEFHATAAHAVDAGIAETISRITKELDEQQASLTAKISEQIVQTSLQRSGKAAEEYLAELLPRLESQFSDQLISRMNQEKEQICARACEEVAGEFEKAAASARALQDATRANAEQEIRQSSANALDQLRADANGLLEETVRQADEHLKQEAAKRAGETLEEIQGRLAQSAQETVAGKLSEVKEVFLEEIRRQFSALTKSTAAAMNKQAVAGLDRYQSELRATAEKEFAAATERLKRTGQDAIAEATELLRASLTGAFSSLSPGGKKKSPTTDET
jgi:hypothetical protein